MSILQLTIPTAMTVPEMCIEHTDLKLKIAQLKKKLDKVESDIVAAVDVKTEGSITTKFDGLKVTTTGKVYRKVDESKLTELRKSVSRTIFNKVLKTSHSVTKKELDYLMNNEPEIYAEFAKVITSTGGKTALKIEVA